MSTISDARAVSQQALARALPRRWAHVQGVARQAERVAACLTLDPSVLVAAAWLHDVGYAPDLVTTGFHPLDGARYLSLIGAPTRIVNLVARHSNAMLEAEIRGLAGRLSAFPDECGPLRDALWYCDLTTSPDGCAVSAPDRLAEIKERYGPGHVVTQFVTEGAADLLTAVGRTDQLLRTAART